MTRQPACRLAAGRLAAWRQLVQVCDLLRQARQSPDLHANERGYDDDARRRRPTIVVVEPIKIIDLEMSRAVPAGELASLDERERGSRGGGGSLVTMMKNERLAPDWVVAFCSGSRRRRCPSFLKTAPIQRSRSAQSERGSAKLAPWRWRRRSGPARRTATAEKAAPLAQPERQHAQIESDPADQSAGSSATANR
jgi:hypothetical protein